MSDDKVGVREGRETSGVMDPKITVIVGDGTSFSSSPRFLTRRDVGYYGIR